MVETKILIDVWLMTMLVIILLSVYGEKKIDLTKPTMIIAATLCSGGAVLLFLAVNSISTMIIGLM